MAKKLTVMIIGGGAREHSLSNKYVKSNKVGKIIVAPGNDFIAYNQKKEIKLEKNCSLTDPSSLLKIAHKYLPDIIDVAQDDALAVGTVNLLRKKGFNVFGPKKSAARIEWDKRWSREFMQRRKIPSPEFKYFDSTKSAKEYVKGLYSKNPDKLLYVKAAGLCAGKGALKAESLEESIQRIEEMKQFGKAGKIFLIEEGLVGEEFSYYAISDGKNYSILKSAQDNKTVFNFDEGDQTGGMGAVSPAMVTADISEEIEEHFISKVINGMLLEHNPYTGILYFGGIKTDEGVMNIEYNARWGDPECQVVLPSIKNDYSDIILACLEGRLGSLKIKQDKKTRVCVIGASKGYPGDYSRVKGKRIYGLEDAMKIKGVAILGAAIAIDNGKFYANGGRLFSIVGEGKNIVDARQKAYSAMACISIEGNNLHYRTDIGWRDVRRFRKD